MLASPPQSVLTYCRTSQNRRKTVLMVALALAAVVPFILGLSYGVAGVVVPGFGFLGFASEVSHSLDKSDRPVFQGDPGDWSEQIYARNADVQRQVRQQHEAHLQEEEAGRSLHDPMVIWIAVCLTALLGLLFWWVASSPASRILSTWSTRLAATEESEVKAWLEQLAIAAGLPAPRLYVIEAAAPNAFASRSGNHAVVAVTRGLLNLLDRQELEAVLAHELSHIGNHDTRVNTVVGTIVLFLRLPYLLRNYRKQVRDGHHDLTGFFPVHPLCYIALLPIQVYFFVIAPAFAVLLRAALSRNRECLADADAVLLTCNPTGLIRALAKIHGAGSSLPSSNPAFAHFYFADPSQPGSGTGLFNDNLVSTHPAISERVQRVIDRNGSVPASVIEEAYLAGKSFAKSLEAAATIPPQTGMHDEFALLTAGNTMGRVYRVVGTTVPAPVYDRPKLSSQVLARVEPGQLIVVFDDPGPFRQVNTCRSQIFGYMPRSVKLQAVDMPPEDAYNASTRAAAESAQPAPSAVASAAQRDGLTPRQILLLTVFAAIVFGAAYLALSSLGR